MGKRRSEIVMLVRAGVAGAALVAGLVLFACGEEDDGKRRAPRAGGAVAREAPAARSAQAPPTSDFLRRADALCLEAKRQAAPVSDAIAAKVADEDAAGVAAELRKGLPIADRLLARMRALTPPSGDGRQVGEFLNIVAKQRRRILPLVEALEAEDISTVEVLVSDLREDNRRAERVAKSYGFTNCGPVGLPAG